MKNLASIKYYLYKFRYNILVAVNILLGLASNFVFLFFFGLSGGMDLYTIALMISAVLTLLLNSFSEQFLYFLNSIKDRKNEANNFYCSVFSITIIGGLCFCLIVNASIPVLTNLFLSGLNEEQALLFSALFRLLTFVSFFAPLNSILNAILLSEGRVGLVYFGLIAQNTIALLVVLLTNVFGYRDVVFIPIGVLSGTIAVFVFWYIQVYSMHYHFRFYWGYKNIKKYLLNSFIMRLGHNINNIFVPLIVSNRLSYAAIGSASAYSYGKKISDVVFQITTGPDFLILKNTISIKWHEGASLEIEALIKRFHLALIRKFVPFAILIGVIAYFFLNSLLTKLSALDVKYIALFYVLFVAWSIILLIEAPYVQVIVSSKKTRPLIIVNSLGVIIILIIANIFSDFFGVFSLPLSFLVSQFSNLFLYRIIAARLLSINKAREEYET